MLGRMGPKGRLVPSVHLFSINLNSSCLLHLYNSGFVLFCKKKLDNTKNRFPFVPQCPIFGKNGPNNQNPEDLPRFYKIAHQMKILSKIVKNRQKMAKNRQKMAKKPDFSGFPENAENRRFSENRKQ